MVLGGQAGNVLLSSQVSRVLRDSRKPGKNLLDYTS